MSESNVMTMTRVTKVTINIGVGEGGNRLQTAERVLEVLTGATPGSNSSKKTNRDLGTREGAPIGCKVTIRNQEQIQSFLKDAFWVRENTLPAWNFDSQGNLSFGVADYTDFPQQSMTLILVYLVWTLMSFWNALVTGLADVDAVLIVWH